MIFQTAVRIYVGSHEKSQGGFFLFIPTNLNEQNRKNFGQKMRKIFIMF
jgi:hypothetical protein